MTLQLEEGKFYRTRDGRKVGPMRKSDGGKLAFPWWDIDHIASSLPEDLRICIWYPDGTANSADGQNFDLVAEWTDDPAPTAPAMTIQQARIEALRIALSTQPWVLVVEELDNVERAAQFIIEGVK